MTQAVLRAMILTMLPAAVAMADDAAVARNVAEKDYRRALEKIRNDDALETEKCRHGVGAAVDACLIQAHGKRMRAEQEAKAKVDRAGRTQPLPDAEAASASKQALDTAKSENRSVTKDIKMEPKSADAECGKLGGDERKACIGEVEQHRKDARNEADAMYEKARSDAKAIKAP